MTGLGKPLSIVIIDDNEALRLLTEELLMAWGHDVRSAPDGGAGVELVLQMQPDVVLLNLALPSRDGYAVAEQLRSEVNLKPLRIIAFTGFSDQATKLRVQQAGFDAYLIKPVTVEDFRRVLRA